MVETANRSLDPKAVQKANSQFYAQHPEMKGQAIDPSNPSHKTYVQAWQAYYRKATAETEKKKKAIKKKSEKKKQESKKKSKSPFTDKPVGSTTQSCPSNSSTTSPQQSTPPPDNPPCNVNVKICKANISIQCSHQASRLGTGKLLEVVPDAAGGDEIKLIANPIGGCGKPVKWKISGLTTEEKTGNRQSFTVQPLAFRHMSISPLGRWAMKAAPMVYRIQPRLECGSIADSYTIKAYPGEQFSVKITPKSWGLYKNLEDGINEFCDWIFGEKRLNIITPQGSIAVNAQWKEHTDFRAFYFFEIVIALDPLFGITGRILLLDALRTLSVPPKVIDWIRRYLGDILYLAAEGKVGASGHLQRISPDNYSNWSGQGKGEIVLKIGAELGKSSKVFAFNASGESGISLVLQLDSYKKDPTDKIFKSDLLFSGLKSKISVEVAGGWLSFEEEYQIINARAIFSNHQLTIFD